MSDWQQEREELGRRVSTLRDQGHCPTCYDLETGELFGNGDRLIFEDAHFKVVLERYPRMPGHIIIIYKPHREDVSELDEDEAALVMMMCLRVIKAIKTSLGAEKVYLNTMCDGPRNHLHLQLFPRYKGEAIGSRRFVLPRGPIEEAGTTGAQIREAFEGRSSD